MHSGNLVEARAANFTHETEALPQSRQMYSKCKDRVLTHARVLVLAFRKPHATGRGVDLSRESSLEQKAKSNVKFRG